MGFVTKRPDGRTKPWNPCVLYYYNIYIYNIYILYYNKIIIIIIIIYIYIGKDN
jgi:hypothetical protein